MQFNYHKNCWLAYFAACACAIQFREDKNRNAAFYNGPCVLSRSGAAPHFFNTCTETSPPDHPRPQSQPARASGPCLPLSPSRNYRATWTGLGRGQEAAMERPTTMDTTSLRIAFMCMICKPHRASRRGYAVAHFFSKKAAMEFSLRDLPE